MVLIQIGVFFFSGNNWIYSESLRHYQFRVFRELRTYLNLDEEIEP